MGKRNWVLVGIMGLSGVIASSGWADDQCHGPGTDVDPHKQMGDMAQIVARIIPDCSDRPATVNVEVLPPVDTSGWEPDSIDEHVEHVRNLYLEALGRDRDGHIVTPLKVVKN